MLEGESQAGPPPHRLGYQRDPIDLQVIEQLFEVLGERAAPRTIWHIGRLPKSSMVEANAAVPAREYWYLLPPTQVVPPCTVSEDHGWAISMDLKVQFNPIDLCFWHVRSPRSSMTWWEKEHSKLSILSPRQQHDNRHGTPSIMPYRSAWP
jgi:hypothetical protein